MFSVLIEFKTFSNLLLIFSLTLVSCFWAYLRFKKQSRMSLAPVIVLNVLFFVAWWRLVGIDTDEAEHLHCAWMVSQGLVPFKDFWQHHSPLVWLVLAPLLKIFNPGGFIFEISRIISALIFTASAMVGWQIAKKVWQHERAIGTYVLVLASVSVLGEFLWLRPDVFMVFFLLCGLYFSLEIPGKKAFSVFFSGISFALAASFAFKQYLLFLVPPLIIMSEKRNKRTLKLCIYCVAFVIGSLPLLLYLYTHHIIREYFLWVFLSNGERIVVSALFPLAVGCMGVWGAYRLFVRFKKDNQDTAALILCVVLLLATVGSFTGSVYPAGGYYLEFWFMVCAILASGYDIPALLLKVPDRLARSLAAGILVGILIAPNAIHAKVHRKTLFSLDKSVVTRLIHYCTNDTCVVFLPLHPVFCRDATRLYSQWQYYFIEKYPRDKIDAKSKNIAEQIIAQRPAVIKYTLEKKGIFLSLFLKDLITREDYIKLKSFLKAGYTVKDIGKGDYYYIRNDKL